MWKHLLAFLSVVLMLGFFNLGCEPPPENSGNGGGYEQEVPEQNPYQEPPEQESPGDYN